MACNRRQHLHRTHCVCDDIVRPIELCFSISEIESHRDGENEHRVVDCVGFHLVVSSLVQWMDTDAVDLVKSICLLYLCALDNRSSAQWECRKARKRLGIK